MIRFIWTVSIFIADAHIGRLLWNWFVAPLGMPTLSLAHAAGLALLAELWTYQFSAYEVHLIKKTDTADEIIYCAVNLLRRVLIIALGLLCHSILKTN